MTIQDNQEEPRGSLLKAALSIPIPGLGQLVGGAVGRAFTIFFSIATLAGLTIWTAAQNARFPDYAFTGRAFLIYLGETAAIFIFLSAIYYLAGRTIAQRPTTQAVARVMLIAAGILAVAIVQDQLIFSAVQGEELREIYALTALIGAAIISAMWLWNIQDAYHLAPVEDDRASASTVVLLLCLGLLVLGTRVTQIDLPKAVRDYRDTSVILRRIVWPWQAAFVYETDDVTAEAKIQAPCPPDADPPPINEPKEDEPWIVVTPNCGELSLRNNMGQIELGTELTIRGGNYRPNQEAQIQWQNPIGDPFTPRGVGDATFMIGDEGTFETTLHIPDVTIPSTAAGAQIHTMTVIQSGPVSFTGELSREMKLSLQQMLVTIMMGLMATFVGVILAVPFSFMAARNLMNSIRTTVEGFVGGVVGLALGAYLGNLAASSISAQLGGLQQAPVLIALIYLVLVLGGAILFFQLAANLLERMAKQAFPELVSQIISVVGLGAIGAVIGYYLGRAFASGILGIVYADEFVQEVMLQTSLIGAGIVAVVFGFQGYRIGPQGEVTVGQLIYIFIRTILNIVRSIEPLIWALVGIIWVGPGPFAGFIALTLHTIAALGKLYSEAIESIDPGPIEALQATGANRLQTIVYAVVPQVLPPFIAFTIYRWDINVRLSTIIGLVGGGGIGFLLIQWIRQFQYYNAGIAVWLITITVAVLDFVSAEIRERFV